MKFMTSIISFFVFLLFISATIAQDVSGRDTPPMVASLLGNDMVNSGLAERDFTLSPLGDELFYTIQSTRFVKSVIIYRRKVNGKWQKPVIAPFSGKYRDLEAFFSPDGSSIYFASDRPANPGDSTKDFDIWKTVRKGNEWEEPVNLGPKVNSEKGDEFYPSVTRSGNIYFTASPVNGGIGKEDILVCRFENGNYGERVVLDTTVNTKGYEFNAFVDPEERFILFTCQQGRKDEIGGGDLYISKKNEQDQWMPAVNLGKTVNSKGLDYCPFVSWDKKILFFTSNRNLLAGSDIASFEDLVERLGRPGNGFDDIYWVDFSAIIK